MLFVVSALSAGLAATSLVGLITDRERFEQMWLIKKSHVILSAIEMVVLATMLIIVSSGSPRRASVASLVSGQYAPMFWGGLVLLGLVAPFAIEGYPVFVTRKAETSTTSMVVSVIGEGGVLVGGSCCVCWSFWRSTGAVPVARWRRSPGDRAPRGFLP